MGTVAMASRGMGVEVAGLPDYVSAVRRPVRAVYVRRRIAVGLVAVVAVAVAALAVPATVVPALRWAAEPASAGARRLGAADAAPPPAEVLRRAPATVVVQRGDTLWSIARRLQPEGDVRPLVAELVARHGSTRIAPGDVITLR
jgi:nucleoid-associated protein YgaU